VRAIYEADASSAAGTNTLNYDAGPLVQTEAYSNAWSDGSSNASKPTTYVGVSWRRQTNLYRYVKSRPRGLASKI
jgi:hypothetical protein